MNHPVYDVPRSTTPSVSDGSGAQRYALWLGYAGLIPFVTLATLALLADGELQQLAGTALIAYGAVIISFLGAWHWSAAINHGGDSASPARMVFAVTPALLGWLAILLPFSYGMALVITGLLMACVADGRWQTTAPSWYRRLRQRLTLVATASMTAAVFSQL